MSGTVLPWAHLLQLPEGWKNVPVVGPSQIAIKKSLNPPHGKAKNSADSQPPMAFACYTQS